MKKCETCRFAHAQEPVGGYANYLCRRSTPVVVMDGQWFGRALWPMVETSDWCGDWATKVEPEKETTYDKA